MTCRSTRDLRSDEHILSRLSALDSAAGLVVKQFIGRLIACVFLGSFCLAGPLMVIFALATAVQRAELVISGVHAEATVVAKRQERGSSRPNYAPVVRFTASDGQPYTVSGDFYRPDSAVRFGDRMQVLYQRDHPESARIDSFADLWTLPLVLGAVGAGFCVVPAILWVARLRRRVDAVAPDQQEHARVVADRVSLGFRRALSVLVGSGGLAILAAALGVISPDQGANGVQIPAIGMGVLLISAGVQIGQWVATDGRLSHLMGSLVITSLAVLFGWAAIFGNAADFHGGMSVGGVGVASGATPARIAFGVASLLIGLASLWAWRQVFKPR
jgi:hypothetical protein